ncbi:hypothetical protein UA08_06496 [Talaromyces atroroseus]|uniref:Uncharacterized protein n=1 Tax=Talaromyces atroroseus TaxID=1441469 RepID=A0A225ABC0_TALAT|nr:hypothetical protein UA08_06496 [Talaromyces atroroseus]OKL58252.1 hypothetical protein UA08_06496 [Talaromyces atroroseus]
MNLLVQKQPALIESYDTEKSARDMLPMHKRDASYSLTQPVVSFRSLETSATIIERSGWRIGKPIRWKTSLNVEDAEIIIRKPFVSHIIDRLYQITSLIETAQEYGWINEEFRYFIQEGAAGSVVIEMREKIHLMAQTPRDDMPFFSFALTQLSTSAGSITASPSSGNSISRSFDWVCLFFASADFDLESIFTRDVFPPDYHEPHRSPDFMALPTWILRWQVEHLRRSLFELRSTIVADNEINMKTPSREHLVLIREKIFQREKSHLMLHRRWLFAKELADTLLRSFEIITTRTNNKNCLEVHSEIAKQNVMTQQSMLQAIQHDLDMTPWSIKAQY